MKNVELTDLDLVQIAGGMEKLSGLLGSQSSSGNGSSGTPKRKPPPEGWLTLGDDFLREYKGPVADPYTPTVRVPRGASAPTVATLVPPVETRRPATSPSSLPAV